MRAPFDGKIVGLRTAVGKGVVPAKTLFTLIDTANGKPSPSSAKQSDRHRQPRLCLRHGGSGTSYFRHGRGCRLGRALGRFRDDPRHTDRFRLVELGEGRQALPVHVWLENPPEDLMPVGASAVVVIGPAPNDADAVPAAK